MALWAQEVKVPITAEAPAAAGIMEAAAEVWGVRAAVPVAAAEAVMCRPEGLLKAEFIRVTVR